jgi:hypothetical protein
MYILVDWIFKYFQFCLRFCVSFRDLHLPIPFLGYDAYRIIYSVHNCRNVFIKITNQRLFCYDLIAIKFANLPSINKYSKLLSTLLIFEQAPFQKTCVRTSLWVLIQYTRCINIFRRSYNIFLFKTDGVLQNGYFSR